MTKQTKADLLPYFDNFEKGTLRTMEGWSKIGTTRISFYGRNKPRTDVGIPDNNNGETWSLTGYGSDEGILKLAKRHGSEDMVDWMARKCAYALEWVPKWMAVHGIPPGEDARLPGIAPELSDVPTGNANRGDSDIKRHWYPRGIFLALIDPDVQAAAEAQGLGWTKGDIHGFADLIYQWILNGVGLTRPNKLEREPRQHIRYASDLETLEALVSVYEYIGLSDMAKQAWFVAQSYVIFAFNLSNMTGYPGADGKLWLDFNYGGFKRDLNGDWDRPWIWGWYPHGMQMWYRSNEMVAMTKLAIRALVNGEKWFFNLVANRILVSTRWMDPSERGSAPVGMFEGSVFANAHVGGGFLGKHGTTLSAAGEIDTDFTDWTNISDGEVFTRYGGFCSGVGGWKADGDYDATEIKMPDGNTYWHDFGGSVGRVSRFQNSGGPKINTPHVPGLEIANSFDMVDSLVARGLLLSDPKLVDWARVIMFHYLGWCSSSDAHVAHGSQVKNGIVNGMNSVGKPARQWHWAIRNGMWLRELDAAWNVGEGNAIKSGSDSDAGIELDQSHPPDTSLETIREIQAEAEAKLHE